QPIEQLGMRGCLAARAEVRGGGDKALAEMVLPEAIDQDTRRQGVLRTREPLGKLEAAARAPGNVQRLIAQETKGIPFDDRPLVTDFASNLYAGIPRSAFGNGVSARYIGRQVALADPGELGLGLVHVGLALLTYRIPLPFQRRQLRSQCVGFL